MIEHQQQPNPTLNLAGATFIEEGDTLHVGGEARMNGQVVSLAMSVQREPGMSFFLLSDGRLTTSAVDEAPFALVAWVDQNDELNIIKHGGA